MGPATKRNCFKRYVIVPVLLLLPPLIFLASTPSTVSTGENSTFLNNIIANVSKVEEAVAPTSTPTAAKALRLQLPDLKRQEMSERLSRVRAWCATTGRDRARWGRAPATDEWNFLIDEAHALASCNIPKVATTTILKVFLRLSNFSAATKDKFVNSKFNLHKEVLNHYRRRAGSFKTISQLVDYLEQRNFTPFVFVRHPFERLVSAFEDKILRSRHERRYYQQLAARLKFDFSNFVDHVLSESRRGNNCSLLRGGCGVDEHFRPYYSSCALCDIPYQAVGKLETFEEDMRYVAALAKVNGKVREEDFSLRMNSGQKKDRTAGIRYLAKLDNSRRRGLLDLYAHDFELFGYSAEDYMEQKDTIRSSEQDGEDRPT